METEMTDARLEGVREEDIDRDTAEYQGYTGSLARSKKRLEEWLAAHDLKAVPQNVRSEHADASLAHRDPLWTDRQRVLAQEHEALGIYGVWFTVLSIASWEARDDIRTAKEPSQTKPRARREEMFQDSQKALQDGDWEEEEDGEGEGDEIGDTQEAEDEAIIEDTQEVEDESIIEDTQEVEDEAMIEDTQEAEDEAETTYRFCHKEWQEITDDANRGADSRMLYYLSSLPSELLYALVSSTLPWKMQDPAFKAKVERHTKLRPCQGTYVTYLAVSPFEEIHDRDRGFVNKDAVGRSLTLRHLIQVVDDMRDYINVDGGSLELAVAIDNVTSCGRCPKGIDYRECRRYGSGSYHDRFHAIEDFLENIEANIVAWGRDLVDTDQDHLLDEHLRHCIGYYGLASIVRDRGPSHGTPRTTPSSVFGLLIAATAHRFGSAYGTRWYTYQVFRTVDRNDIGLDEILTTVMCSGHTWDGGVNGWAGLSKGNGPNRSDEDYIRQLMNSKRDFAELGVSKRNVEDGAAQVARLKDLSEMEKHKSSAVERHQLATDLNCLLKFEMDIRDLAGNIEDLEEDETHGTSGAGLK